VINAQEKVVLSAKRIGTFSDALLDPPAPNKSEGRRAYRGASVDDRKPIIVPLAATLHDRASFSCGEAGPGRHLQRQHLRMFAVAWRKCSWRSGTHRTTLQAITA
jgi:hypothetical protein